MLPDMGKLRDINETIAEKRALIQRLHSELEVLERARGLLNGGSHTGAPILRSVRPATVRVVSRPGTKKGKPVHPKRGVVSPDSDVGLAIAALRDATEPLHVGAILDRIEQKAGRRPKKHSLVGSLARFTKEGQHFYRAGGNIYGLLEWRTLPGKKT
jgi:hypothetical protein